MCNNIFVTRMPPRWDIQGRSDGFIRNRKMANYADQAIILWDGKSHGTLNMIETMQKLNKPVYVVTVKED